jgi:hypothetical protein
MRRVWSHAEIDRENAADDRKIAAQLRRDGRLLRIARNNLRRWMRRRRHRPNSPFHEWNQILTVLTRREIADFLVSDTPMCRRLRQSSPFMGLPIKKNASKQRRHHKART